MADYYTKFSFVITLPDKAARQYALDLFEQGRGIWLRGFDEGLPAEPTWAVMPVELAGDQEAFCFLCDPEDALGLWIHDDAGGGGVEAAAHFVQHLLKRFPGAPGADFEWSNDCSQPQVDAYGGGAVIITPAECRFFNTSQWLAEQRAPKPNPA